MRVIFVAILWLVFAQNSVSASVWPTASVGDDVTGSFFIDLSAPLTYPGPGYPEYGGVNAGTISISFDSFTITTGISNYVPGLGIAAGTAPDPTNPGRTIYTYLYLFPLAPRPSAYTLQLSSYSFFSGGDVNFGYRDQEDLGGYGYQASLNSITQLDNLGNFQFDATLISAQAVSPNVPEPSTWAMLLIGFAGIGLMTYRRRKSAMLAPDVIIERRSCRGSNGSLATQPLRRSRLHRSGASCAR
jgi:hypothetical protein